MPPHCVIRGWTAPIAALALAACTHGIIPGAHSRPDAAAEIRALTAAYLAAWNAGDVAALSALLAADALVITPEGAEPEDPAAYRRASVAYFDRFSATQTATTDEVDVQGGVAVARGTWSIRETPRTGGEAQTRSGNWLAVQKRQADGSWKPWRWIFSQTGQAGMASVGGPASAGGPASVASPGAVAGAAVLSPAEQEIGALLAAYNAAINSRNEARVRELYPSISNAGVRDLMRMRSTDVIQVTLLPGTLHPVGAGRRQEVQVSAAIVPVEGIGESRRLIYTVDRGPAGWYIVSIRRPPTSQRR